MKKIELTREENDLLVDALEYYETDYVSTNESQEWATLLNKLEKALEINW